MNSRPAEAELRGIVEAFESLSDFRPNKDYLNSIGVWADTLFELKRFEEAEAQFRKAYKGRFEIQGSTYYATLESETRIGRAMIAAGKFAAAEKETAEILTRRISEFGATSSRTCNPRINYFNALVGLKRNDEAETFLLDSWKQFSEKRGADEKYTRRLEQLMVKYYETHEMTEQLKKFKTSIKTDLKQEDTASDK